MACEPRYLREGHVAGSHRTSPCASARRGTAFADARTTTTKVVGCPLQLQLPLQVQLQTSQQPGLMSQYVMSLRELLFQPTHCLQKPGAGNDDGYDENVVIDGCLVGG